MLTEIGTVILIKNKYLPVLSKDRLDPCLDCGFDPVLEPGRDPPGVKVVLITNNELDLDTLITQKKK